MIDVRVLPADGIGLIAEIDRSEHIDALFDVRAGELTSRPVDIPARVVVDVPRSRVCDQHLRHPPRPDTPTAVESLLVGVATVGEFWIIGYLLVFGVRGSDRSSVPASPIGAA